MTVAMWVKVQTGRQARHPQAAAVDELVNLIKGNGDYSISNSMFLHFTQWTEYNYSMHCVKNGSK